MWAVGYLKATRDPGSDRALHASSMYTEFLSLRANSLGGELLLEEALLRDAANEVLGLEALGLHPVVVHEL
eukprot:CAMPEP_0194763568 /NCGR_PEP_ID=MMETSP0323_2-20130528/19862_1 /TAXON_ID=2866 ORGANISM="Crypthecodinium cohnii, Strain Seligo" /NCGR_SAMPLE_ID=MMETSP0323_2 /ASSEMBLY_ACC=CAM_ASM_000346 /LENGTH=70 /DNA_ID=CAMNT_0039688655 /DNA_START=147 /DNA_END=356 /DNA_ORIENTATION=-